MENSPNHFETQKKRSISGSDVTRNKIKKKQKKDKHDHGDSDYVPVIEPSSSAIQRVFSPSEEVSILQGMIDFRKENNNSNPTSNMTSFLTYLQDSQVIGHHIQKRQLSEKIRRLKAKFNNQASTAPPDPLDSHQSKLFKLSTKIWGEEIVQEEKNSSNGDSKRMTKRAQEFLMECFRDQVGPHYKEDEFELMYPHLNDLLEREGGKFIFIKKLKSIRSRELKEMENDCKQVERLKLKAVKRATKAINDLRTKWLSD